MTKLTIKQKLLRIGLMLLIAGSLSYTLWSIFVATFLLRPDTGWALMIMVIPVVWTSWTSLLGYFAVFKEGV